ncbi:MAG: helix-turn-helix transcriptional regulator, partial [Clostridia bacterium]|nr:helix-turn-helix transcriptional regulator [Clostridia bacterium]
MEFTTAEKINIICKKRDMTLTQLAEATGQTRQNLSNKLKRDNFSEKEIKKIAEALNCTYLTAFKLNDTEEIL